jgi:hypothetical protein
MIIIWGFSFSAFAQLQESPIKMFGYFQNQFKYEKMKKSGTTSTSFIMQQLNLFLQKDLAKNWTAFINFELVNSFSSNRQWGAYNLEEAWTRFRLSKEFNFKLGLQIPIFNNLNEIKNRTPLLPYITRPLVYETSFNDFLALEEYLPNRAYVQTYGFLSLDNYKLDYALYLGNSPNVNNDPQKGQTGVDTSSTFLVGGRVGVRMKELKFGISGTYDKVNFDFGDTPDSDSVAAILGVQVSDFERVGRTRLGTDLSYNFWNFSFEGEYISVDYDDNITVWNRGNKFYYTTLGYHITDQLFIYASYWFTEEKFILVNPNEAGELIIERGDFEIIVPNAGLSYSYGDRMTFKLQFAHVDIGSDTSDLVPDEQLKILAGAISIFF